MSLRLELRKTKEELVEEIEGLRKEVRALTSEKEELGQEAKLTRQINDLKKEKVDLEIEAAKKQEAFDREKREVEHMVGLERKKSEFETDSARRLAELQVREQNLNAERKLFEERMEALTGGLKSQIDYLQDNLVTQLMGAVTRAMPDTSIALGNGGSNGRTKEEVDA